TASSGSRAARPSTPDTAPSGRAGLLRVRPCVRPGTSRGGDRVDLAKRQRRHTIKETRRNDERGGQARPRGVAEIPGSARPLIMFGSNIVAVSRLSGRSKRPSLRSWVTSAYVL